jgi:hypothetical protein
MIVAGKHSAANAMPGLPFINGRPAFAAIIAISGPQFPTTAQNVSQKI